MVTFPPHTVHPVQLSTAMKGLVDSCRYISDGEYVADVTSSQIKQLMAEHGNDPIPPIGHLYFILVTEDEGEPRFSKQLLQNFADSSSDPV